jgi:hypothetical protein
MPVMSGAPQRLQLFRGAKFDLQEASKTLNGLAAVRIDHKSGWENPFLDRLSTPTASVAMFRRWLLGQMPPDELAACAGRGRFANSAWLANRRLCLLHALPALRAKNLACWCGRRDPCHGDVLLWLSNMHASPIVQTGRIGKPENRETGRFSALFPGNP